MSQDEVNSTPRPVESPPAALRRRVAARRLLRAETFYFAGLAAYAVLALLAYRYAYFGWDLRAARAVQAVGVPGWFEFMVAVSWFGDGLTPHLLAAVTAAGFFGRRRFSEGAALALSAGGGALVNKAFKVLIGRPRPAAELVGFSYTGGGESFPSGHVSFYVCYFGFLFFVAFAILPRGSWQRRAALVLAALPVLLVGFSRVTLRAHWPSDVAGAYLLSGLWLALSLEMYRRWKQRATIKRAAQAVAPGAAGTPPPAAG
ncbi:MAG TPA: phosphatase PAP2 family protein [Pyrinomonadaceae bacterium]|nr:phosphatase PAP2 family protein [Pyrinomonadaceae bacterium]